MLLTILGLLAPLLTPLLAKAGVSASIDNLIEAAIAGVQSIATAIVAGRKSSVTVNGVLVTLQTALAALQADTSLDPAVLADSAEGIRDLQAGITAYQAAEVTTDPSTLTPIAEV